MKYSLYRIFYSRMNPATAFTSYLRYTQPFYAQVYKLMAKQRKMLVTSALPYANGHLHLGHLVEHIQTDIWVRTHRMSGIECISICGDDAHGTPIMLKAEQQGISPEALTAEIKLSHERDFKAFDIAYDCYHTTHSPENKLLASTIYKKLQENGSIIKRTIRQAYDPEKHMFLPDRYVKGTCPKCNAPDQYGDNCEVCGATYSPTDLIDAVSAISGAKPIEKESEHHFFDLPRYEELLKEWTRNGHLQHEVANKLDEWFAAGLKQWDISRDAPYFGFPIPGTADKYFYVWLDAPIGYMASFKKYCAEHDEVSFAEFWDKDSTTELYHFVGKDIVYFHALFWPALLAASGHRTPTAVYTHGFLTVDGQKMSKSRGTFLEARVYLEHLHPEYLRYYFAAKLNGRVDDLDLNFDDFTNRINADLVGKIVNIASRCAGFINKRFDNYLSPHLSETSLYTDLLAIRTEVIESFVSRDYARAIRHIMDCADKVNQYIDSNKPWILAKEERLPEVQAICTMGINLFRILMTYLKPVLPLMATAAEEFLNCDPLTWEAIDKPLLNHRLNTFQPLMVRVEKEKIQAMLEQSKQEHHGLS